LWPGLGVSSYVLARLLPDASAEFEALVREVAVAEDRRYPLAELNDLLASTPAVEFPHVVTSVRLDILTPYLQNYVAAMVEQAAASKRLPAPSWVRSVPPLAEPIFATALTTLRPHLLRSSPVPFTRRNIFVDAAVGARA
jgi:hypothetical protein